MKYSEIRQHVTDLRQCSLLTCNESVIASMSDAANFLESLIPPLEHTEHRVLMVLQSVGEDYALNFKGVVSNFYRMFDSVIDEKTAKKYCRSLKDKGLAEYRRGLFDETYGTTAGAGYSVTTEGIRFNV